MTRERNNLFSAINEAGLRYTGLLKRTIVGRDNEVFRRVGENEWVESARTVRGLENIPNYRWGGPALYTSLYRVAGKNEMLSYSEELRQEKVLGRVYYIRGGADVQKIVAKSTLWKFKLNSTIAPVSFDPRDSGFRTYLRLIDSNPAVGAAKKDAQFHWSLEDRVFVLTRPIPGQSYPDYLASQAVAAPVLVHLKTPIIAPSAPHEVKFAPGQGMNLILPGRPHKPVELLRPFSEILLAYAGKGILMEGERRVDASAFDPGIREGQVIDFGPNQTDAQEPE